MANTNVSVIIPAHGHATELAAAIHSALTQALSPLEVIVIDDGSVPLIALPRTNSKVRLERLAINGGPSAARNLGCRVARGDWVAFLDADDLWREDKLALQLADRDPAEDILLACNVLVVEGSGRRPHNTVPPTAPLDRWLLIDDQTLQTSGLVLPRRLALRFPFDERLRACEDWDLVLRLDAAGVAIDYRVDCLVSYHRDKGSHGRLKQRMPSVLAWLDDPVNVASPAARLHYYAHHLFLPHLGQNPLVALTTLRAIAALCPHASDILGDVARRKLSRSRIATLAD